MQINNIIINRKPLPLIKNQEYVFELPVLVPKYADYQIECPALETFDGVIFTIFLSKNGHKVESSVILQPGFNELGFYDKEFTEEGDYTLMTCKASETVNLALTVKKEQF